MRVSSWGLVKKRALMRQVILGGQGVEDWKPITCVIGMLLSSESKETEMP